MLRSLQPALDIPAVPTDPADPQDDNQRTSGGLSAASPLRLAASAQARVYEARARGWNPSSHVLWFGPGVNSLHIRSISENH